MKNTFLLLFVLFAATLFSQTKDKSLTEMNAIVRKVEDASAEKGYVKIVKQVLNKSIGSKSKRVTTLLMVKLKIFHGRAIALVKKNLIIVQA